MTTVYAFDRDHTVDTNPHPERAAVPLDWIVELRAREGTSVWAIGNQRLTHEAGIPGVVELQTRLGDGGVRTRGLQLLTGLDRLLPATAADAMIPDPVAEALADVSMPPRRERLRLLERLFPDADGYVVVDDADLRDVEGWTHYFPWEFYREFRGEFDGWDDPERNAGSSSADP